MIRKEAWPFYRTIFSVCLCWELEEPEGPKGQEGLASRGRPLQGYLAYEAVTIRNKAFLRGGFLDMFEKRGAFCVRFLICFRNKACVSKPVGRNPEETMKKPYIEETRRTFFMSEVLL